MWEWQDVDVQGSRIRSRGVKGRRGTRRVLWRQVPPWLLEVLIASVPRDDDRTFERRPVPRPERGHDARRDRPRLTGRRDPPLLAARPSASPRIALARGRNAGTRGRRTVGHAKASMSLDVYTHVMPPDEAGADNLLPLLTDERR